MTDRVGGGPGDGGASASLGGGSDVSHGSGGSPAGARLIGLGARVHLFVRPGARHAFVALFRDTLGCEVAELEFGLEDPIALVRFADGSAFSVETTELAPPDPPGDVDDEGAFHGAWIEFRTPDVPAVQAALRQAGVAEFRHPGSAHVYFSAPGGQVFRVLDVGYVGP